MSLDEWIKKAKKDGAFIDPSNPKPQEEKKMEVEIMGSSPIGKEPRDILPKPTNERKGLRPDERFNALNEFCQMCPLVNRWLECKRTKLAKRSYGYPLLNFCIEANIMPQDFIELHHTHDEIVKARDMVWNVCLDLMKEDRNNYAVNTRKSCKAFYKWANKAEAELPFDSSATGFHFIPPGEEREAYDWGTVEESRELFFNILSFAPNLLYRTIYMLDFVAGWRINTFDSLKWKHFESPGIKTINGREVLIVKITKELDDKQSKALKYYWSFIMDEVLRLLQQYKETCSHREPDDYVFYYTEGPQKGQRLQSGQIRATFKKMLRSAEEQGIIPKGASKNIWFHQIRKHCFRKIIQNTDGIEYENKEFLMGHKLKGTAESYATRNYEILAPEYFKANFAPPIKYYKEKQRFEEKLREEAEAKIERYEKTYPDLTELPEEAETMREDEWQTPQIERVSPSLLEGSPMPKETVTMTKTVSVQKVREGMKPLLERVLKPAPKKCLRGKHFGPNDTDEFCHTVCQKQEPNAYRACQELQQETPEQFT